MLLKTIFIISILISMLGFVLGICKTLSSAIRTCLVLMAGMVVLWFLSCFICTRFIDMNKEYTSYSHLYWWFTYCIIESAQQIFRVKLHVSGKEIIPEEKFMLVCNHRSIIDPLVTMNVLREYNMAFIARHEIYRIPLLSRLMHRCNCYCMNRNDIRESAKTIIKASNCIKEDRASIGVYPEGTRNDYENEEMLPFMHGAFKIAKKANCPIVVATLKNNGEMYRRAPFRSTNVYLEFVQVIDKEYIAENNTVQISNTARAIMEENLLVKYQC